MAGQLHHYLEQLDQKATWRLSGLPTGVSVDVLRVLDARGLIELRGWQLDNPTTDLRNPQALIPNPSSFGWVSPTAKPSIYGRWDQLLENIPSNEKLAPEIRLTDAARAELAASRLGLDDRSAPVQQWVTVSEAARAVSKPTYLISRLVNKGKVRGNGKTGRARRVDAADLTRFLLEVEEKQRIKKLQRFQ